MLPTRGTIELSPANVSSDQLEIILSFEWDGDPGFVEGEAVEFEVWIYTPLPKCYAEPEGGRDDRTDAATHNFAYELDAYTDVWNYWIPVSNGVLADTIQEECELNGTTSAIVAIYDDLVNGLDADTDANFAVGVRNPELLEAGFNYQIRYPLQRVDDWACTSRDRREVTVQLRMQTMADTCNLPLFAGTTACPHFIGWSGCAEAQTRPPVFNDWASSICFPTTEINIPNVFEESVSCLDSDGDGYFANDAGEVFGSFTGDCEDNPEYQGVDIYPDAPEECDDIDSDCDGDLAENCECTVGEVPLICGSDVGECTTGIRACVSGEWDPTCQGEMDAISEICGNALDEDCNGIAEACDMQVSFVSASPGGLAPHPMCPGEEQFFTFQYENTGLFTWIDDAGLGVSEPYALDLRSVESTGTLEVDSYLYDEDVVASTWINRQRVKWLDTTPVPPGGVGEFTFIGEVPVSANPGLVDVYFRPFAGGTALDLWSDDHISIDVQDCPVGPTCPVDTDCTGLVCGPDPVCGESCGACAGPPADYCIDANNVRAYDTSGVCLASWCDYPFTDSYCASGCTSGACNSCADDCSYVAETSCATASDVQTCGYFDADTCLDWDVSTLCASGVCAGSTCTLPAPIIVYQQNFLDSMLLDDTIVGSQTFTDSAEWWDGGLFSTLAISSGYAGNGMLVYQSNSSSSDSNLSLTLPASASDQEDVTVSFWAYNSDGAIDVPVRISRTGAVDQVVNVPPQQWTQVQTTLDSTATTTNITLGLGLIVPTTPGYAFKIDEIVVTKQ